MQHKCIEPRLSEYSFLYDKIHGDIWTKYIFKISTEICIYVYLHTHSNRVLLNSKSVLFSQNFVIYSFILYSWNPCSLLYKLGNPIYSTSPNPTYIEKTMNKGMAPMYIPRDSFRWCLGTVSVSGWHINTLA